MNTMTGLDQHFNRISCIGSCTHAQVRNNVIAKIAQIGFGLTK